MRWLVVKLVNLVIVLVVVTFIVAAIFTGPLAERERSQIYTTVQQSIRERFKNVPVMAVYQDCIARGGMEAFDGSIDNITESMIQSPNLTKSLQGLPEDVRVAVIRAVGEAYKQVVHEATKSGSKLGDNQLYAEVVSRAMAILSQQGVSVDKKVVSNFVKNDFTPEVVDKCRSIIVKEEVRRKIHQKGLDKPWYVLSLRYTKMLLKFTPMRATSLTTQYYPTQGDKNVLHIIEERIPFSVSLFTTSSILTLLIAMPLSLIAARRPGNIVDNVITGWSVFSVSMPWWWLAMVFIYLFTVKYHVFPNPIEVKPNWGAVFELSKIITGTSQERAEVLSGLKSIMMAAALPVFTVTILSIGDTAYRIRNILLDVFNEDFVTVARAKGVPEHVVLRKHVLRPAAPPLITIVLFSIVLSVFSGAIITELIFNWYGLGRLYWDAISKNDIPVILELTYITTLLYLVIRFLLDILYTLLDPRIRRA